MDDKSNENCPLESAFGRQWNLEIRKSLQSSPSELCKAESIRRMAADSQLRSKAFLAHGEVEKGLAARLEMESLMLQASELTDNPSGINNYAEPSLHLASTYRNRSKHFKTNLTLEHPIVAKFLSKNQTDSQSKQMQEQTEEVQTFSNFLKNTKESKPKSQDKTNEQENQKPCLSQIQIQKDDCEQRSALSPEVRSVLNVERQTPRFGKHKLAQPQPPLRPTFQNSNVRSSNSSSDFKERTPNFGPKFGLPGIGPRPPPPPIQRPLQRQGSFSNANDSNICGNSDQNKVPQFGGVSAFRTAHDELIIQANQKRGNGVSSSSYGAVKKTLGVPRSGHVAGSFKPPIASKSPGLEAPIETGNNLDPIVNEKLKHLDPKMVELIQNEIMDKGAQVEWSDIAGLDFVKVTVKEIVVFPLLRPDIFKGLRGPPKGLLLFGPPGTGKTLIGKCIACQSRSTFFSISASSLTSKWVGEGEKMVRTLFEVARAFQPAVVFIDEIDSLLSQRSDNEHESSRRIKTEFLVQLDGATSLGDERILVVGATNRPQDLDEAARRRLVKRLYVPLPEQEAREHIVRTLMTSQSHSLTEEDVVLIGAKADGYSGADMANLCKEAAMGPIRSLDYSRIDEITSDEVRPISIEDFMGAFKQVKASVSDKDLQLYKEWDAQFGSGK